MQCLNQTSLKGTLICDSIERVLTDKRVMVTIKLNVEEEKVDPLTGELIVVKNKKFRLVVYNANLAKIASELKQGDIVQFNAELRNTFHFSQRLNREVKSINLVTKKINLLFRPNSV